MKIIKLIKWNNKIIFNDYMEMLKDNDNAVYYIQDKIIKNRKIRKTKKNEHIDHVVKMV